MAETAISWWLYFDSEDMARRAAGEFDRDDFLTLVERSRAPHRPEAWQLRAARPVAVGGFVAELALMHDLTRRYGGHCDGWDSGWLWGEEGLARMTQVLTETSTQL